LCNLQQSAGRFSSQRILDGIVKLEQKNTRLLQEGGYHREFRCYLISIILRTSLAVSVSNR